MPSDPSNPSVPQDPQHFQLPPDALTGAVPGSPPVPPHPQAGMSSLNQLAGQLVAEAPTSAAQWKANRKQGFSVKLPSGATAHVRRTFDMLAKLKEGKIPNPLAGLVQDMIANKRPNIKIEELDQQTLEQMFRMMDETLEAMMISPRFQCRPLDAPWDWEPEDDAIGPHDVGLADKVYLFQLAQGGTADLATFRAQQEHLVGTVPDLAEVPGPTE